MLVVLNALGNKYSVHHEKIQKISFRKFLNQRKKVVLKWLIQAAAVEVVQVAQEGRSSHKGLLAIY